MPAPEPSELGVIDGKLAGCPGSPNCVSTESNDASHQIEPIEFTGSESDARKKLIQVVQKMPRVTLLTETESYLHFECHSRLFRFIDDLEFYIDTKSKKNSNAIGIPHWLFRFRASIEIGSIRFSKLSASVGNEDASYSSVCRFVVVLSLSVKSRYLWLKQMP